MVCGLDNEYQEGIMDFREIGLRVQNMMNYSEFGSQHNWEEFIWLFIEHKNFEFGNE